MRIANSMMLPFRVHVYTHVCDCVAIQVSCYYLLLTHTCLVQMSATLCTLLCHAIRLVVVIMDQQHFLICASLVLVLDSVHHLRHLSLKRAITIQVCTNVYIYIYTYNLLYIYIYAYSMLAMYVRCSRGVNRTVLLLTAVSVAHAVMNRQYWRRNSGQSRSGSSISMYMMWMLYVLHIAKLQLLV